MLVYYRDVLILAIDTCDARGSVSLLDVSGAVFSVVHEDAEDYSTWLLPAVDRVLARAGRRFSEVTLYAAAAGPGSFTGIRVGLTTVKAWNEVFRVPIAAVSRLEALAMQAKGAGERLPRFVAACFVAQRREMFGGVYRRDGEFLTRQGVETVVTPGGLITWATEEAKGEAVAWVCLEAGVLAGEAAWQERERRGEVLEVLEPVVAPAIARMAVQLTAQNKLTDALGLDANYILRPHAEVQWKGYTKPVV
jgi:tRNA threonylcarbamoyladenosine biosynthesis protein TsaB